jgi:hypothetical protein
MAVTKCRSCKSYKGCLSKNGDTLIHIFFVHLSMFSLYSTTQDQNKCYLKLQCDLPDSKLEQNNTYSPFFFTGVDMDRINLKILYNAIVAAITFLAQKESTP